MSDEDTEIGDMTADDAHDDDDGSIDFTQVEAVQEQVDAINAIEDEDERTSAAARWAKELAGDDIG